MGFFDVQGKELLVTWREKLEKELSLQGETFESIEYIHPDESVPVVKRNVEYGLPEGPEFLVFTSRRVYFPVCYDGMEWVGSVPRHPEHIRPGDGRHQGGG